MSETGGTVDIPEYLDTELAAGEELAREPAFWLAHLLVTMGDPSAEADEYDIPPAVFEAMVERLSDAERPWPVFRVPFGGGHTAFAVYANFEDENTVEFAVRHPAWGRLGHLGQCGPEWAGPGLSWAELTTIAASVPPDVLDAPDAPDVPDAPNREGLVDPAQRLLLLLPMLGDDATPEEAWGVVARALVRCGIAAEVAPRFARELLGTDADDRIAEPSWTVSEAGPVPVCSSRHSPRQVPLALGIALDQAQSLADALRGGGRPVLI
ncbi:hypothetical protein OG455_09040 [Kitasatospora sp. NBC_01287]|uniref:hypothetical protein n=1 Tax=Kitasatospora sp. NBC_01287 TaxID=2903573 RepID=UPI00225C40FF|nr:hypothetical protein [Kitasatospora sp. NBC_01287]MCX4745665.1 hypothetical protein [Kitasatospora sp. NBC_01287]